LDRLGKLELQHGRLKHRATVALSLAVVAVLWATLWRRPNVAAETFVLRDAQGKERAKLAVIQSTVTLQLLGVNGKPRLALAVGDEGPQIVLRDGSGAQRLGLGATVDGASGLIVSDVDGQPRAALSTNAEGETELALIDTQGKQRARIAVSLQGSPGIALFDSAGKPLWSPTGHRVELPIQPAKPTAPSATELDNSGP
jgi:hypothetical protein